MLFHDATQLFWNLTVGYTGRQQLRGVPKIEILSRMLNQKVPSLKLAKNARSITLFQMLSVRSASAAASTAGRRFFGCS